MSRAGSVCWDDFQPGITWAPLAGLAQFANWKMKPSFSTNDHRANDLNLVVMFLHLCSWMGYFTSTSYLEGGTLIFCRILCLDEKFNAGALSQTGLINMIIWTTFNPVSLDPGITIPGYGLTGLARMSCNREVDFCCVWHTAKISANQTSPANRASLAHVIRP